MSPILRSLPGWAALALLAASLTGCRFGLDYSGDETGLERREVAVGRPVGGSMSYLIAENPERPRVIFVHGSPGSAAYYGDYLRELRGDAEVIAVDRLGYGASAASGTVVSFERQAAAIAPLLVEQGGSWPIVVGHSLGGPIATRLAADYPGKVGALIVVAGNLDADLEEPRWYNEFARWRLLQPFLAGFLKVSNREMWAAEVQVQGLETKLDRITCPIVFIHGTSDSLVPFEAMRYSVERFRGRPNVFVYVLIGESHGITKLRRDEVLETVRAALAGVTDFVKEDER
jgi:pimeloyl-ACP methyl ester carboxylesterase